MRLTKKMGALATASIAALSILPSAAQASAASKQPGRASSEISAAVNCTDTWPQFRLRSRATGKYVAVEYLYTGDRYAMLRARADYNNANTFTMCTIDGTTNIWVGLKVVGGSYVTAEVNHPGAMDGMLRARSSTVGSWEQFDILCASSNGPDLCDIRSRGTGHYVTTEVNYPGGDDGMLRARSSTVGSWEQFYAEGM